MNYVSYSRGTKKEYEQITNKDRNTLYWCLDSKELFLGANLYSDGLRIVDNYKELPSPSDAAYGILYFCQKEEEGYTLQRISENVDQWVKVLSNDGEVYEAELKRISEKIKSLEKSIIDLQESVKDNIKFKGELENYDTLLAIPNPQTGDLYTLKNSGGQWIRTKDNFWLQINKKIEQHLKIKLGNNRIITEKENMINFPTASLQELGVVKSSAMENQVSVKEDGTMELNKINIQKISQNVDDNLILNCGNSKLK